MPEREYYDPDTGQVWATDDEGNYWYVRESTPQESPVSTPGGNGPSVETAPSFFDQIMEAVGGIGRPPISYREPTPYGATAPVSQVTPGEIEAQYGRGVQGYTRKGFLGIGNRVYLPPEPSPILTQHEVGHYIGPEQRQRYAQEQGIPVYGALPAQVQEYVRGGYGTLPRSPQKAQEELEAEWFALMRSPLSAWRKTARPTSGYGEY